MKKKNQPVLRLCDSLGRVLFCGEIMDLEFSEELIIRKSVEFFNDPEPCFIHRGAVIIRMQEEVCQSIREAGGQADAPQLPAEIQECFRRYSGTARITLLE